MAKKKKMSEKEIIKLLGKLGYEPSGTGHKKLVQKIMKGVKPELRRRKKGK